MQPSRFNILSRLPGRKDWVVVNLLSGEADLLEGDEVQFLQPGARDIPRAFVEKGYWCDPEAEELAYRLRYIDFLEKREQEEVQVLFVPTYQCNFDCSYCYQSDYGQEAAALHPGITDAFFGFLREVVAPKKHYVTLFGGEPFLDGAGYHRALSVFIARCGKEGTDLAVVTNGYHLDRYLDVLGQAKVREIQLTLDGPPDVHDARRPLRGNRPSFDKISRNLDRCLDRGYPVNLRVVADRGNMQHLPALARLSAQRGWTGHPLFKTQLGRNYELHSCQASPDRLYSRLEFYTDYHDLAKEHPELLDFHKPALSVSRYLSENGQLPPPLFDACPACKSEWALDLHGRVYACTATVGKEGEALGRFYPRLELNGQAVRAWQQRDVTQIPECSHCALQLACGGGCASLAKNRHGSLLAPDCRPADGLIGLGASLYF